MKVMMYEYIFVYIVLPLIIIIKIIDFFVGKKNITQSRTGLQIYEGRDDRPTQ
jgi:hypothetical protein